MAIVVRITRLLLVLGSLALVGYAVVSGGLHGWANGDVLNPLLIGVLILGEYAVTRLGRGRVVRPPHPRVRGRLSGRPRRTNCRPAGRRDAARNRRSTARADR